MDNYTNKNWILNDDSTKNLHWIYLAEILKKYSIKDLSQFQERNQVSKTSIDRIMQAHSFIINRYPEISVKSIKTSAYSITFLPKIIASWKNDNVDNEKIEKRIFNILEGKTSISSFLEKKSKKMTTKNPLIITFTSILKGVEQFIDILLKKTEERNTPQEFRMLCKNVARKLNALVDESFRKRYKETYTIEFNKGDEECGKK